MLKLVSRVRRACLQIVLEFVHGGTLTEVLGPTIPFPEAGIAYCCRELIRGLAFMHRNHKLHRDIKSDNILVGFNGDVKIADFGFAASLTQEVRRERGQHAVNISTACRCSNIIPHLADKTHCHRWFACTYSKTSGNRWLARRTGWRLS